MSKTIVWETIDTIKYCRLLRLMLCNMKFVFKQINGKNKWQGHPDLQLFLSQISLVLVCQLLYLVVANIYLIELVKHPLFLIGVIHHQTLIVWQSLLIHSSLKVILVLFIVHKVVSLPSDSPLRHPQSKFLSLGKVGRQIRLTSKLWWGRGLKNLIVSVNLSAIGS